MPDRREQDERNQAMAMFVYKLLGLVSITGLFADDRRRFKSNRYQAIRSQPLRDMGSGMESTPAPERPDKPLRNAGLTREEKDRRN